LVRFGAVLNKLDTVLLANWVVDGSVVVVDDDPKLYPVVSANTKSLAVKIDIPIANMAVVIVIISIIFDDFGFNSIYYTIL